jgi:hypothetical protein
VPCQAPLRSDAKRPRRAPAALGARSAAHGRLARG